VGFIQYSVKTTIEISDNLLSRAKQLAREQEVTLRSLVEAGLLQVLKERSQRTNTPIQPVVFGGNGLRPELKDRPWQTIRDAAYEGHGA
jgi:hypothetical protein